MYMRRCDFYCPLRISLSVEPRASWRILPVGAERRNGGDCMGKRRRGRVAEDERMPGARAQKVAGALQLPPGMLSGGARFEMNGNREVIVDGCRNVLEYNENEVRINAGKMIVSFMGRGMTLKCLTPDSLVIEGFITSIEFVS